MDLSAIGDFIKGKKDLAEARRMMEKVTVTNVYAPLKKGARRTIVSTSDKEITEIALSAKASMTTISSQIDSAVQGQFRTKVETVLDEKQAAFDELSYGE
ncbi:hypothetical protein [Streptococcus iniae]|uniref:Uncharacterized protein n=1 Tax=Streptococcus iniae TaxID=1346 RepID=A0A3M2NIE8_STRIN|nr:hypothetical protein [Streptococcus iniae]AJG25242.1 hypothetical protein SI82_01085 [Streptococcus iniae]ATX38965.1 hypothetical protein CTW00_00764 [Streptococcus iniae]EKB52330.1 hypothetical protein A0G_0165 [Streptococcus iniae 9117]ELY5750245.1 hypothetical protein [Streptococcus iniae]ELY5752220.1 hypothetical protein [Streptococcus iniae]